MTTSPKTILITGATSGFGKIAVQNLLAAGHVVVAAVRGGQARLEAVYGEELERLKAEGGPRRLFAVDVHMEKPETFESARVLIERDLGGRLDVLINNAGYVLLGPVEAQSEEEIRSQFEVNVFGPVRLTQVLLPALKAARGRVLNVSSAVGYAPLPLFSTYAASKHALEALTEGLYYDLKPQGVQVGLIEPGSFRTEIVSSTRLAAAATNPASEWHAPLANLIAFNRDNLKYGGDPARVARLLVSLSERRKVPLRSFIGPDSWLHIGLKRWLPEGYRAALVEWVFRRFVLSGRKRPNRAHLEQPRLG